MTLPKIIATNDNIHRLIELEVHLQGNNADLNHIDVSNVTNMDNVFSKCRTFNGDISRWNVSNVISMKHMFQYSRFNGDISKWDVSNVRDMTEMFENSEFEGDLSKWDVSNVNFMAGMFKDSSFNGDISNWNVSQVVTMVNMFKDNYYFNKPLNNWNVSKVALMSGMFENTRFNQPLSQWNTSSLKYAESMFKNNTHFNHPISTWNFSNIAVAEAMFENSKMYSALPSFVPADAMTTRLLENIPYPPLFPLSNINDVENYKTYLKNLYSSSPRKKLPAAVMKQLRSEDSLKPHHGVLALVFEDLDSRTIHSDLTDEHRNTLKTLYQITHSVHLSVEEWMNTFVLHKSTVELVNHTFDL